MGAGVARECSQQLPNWKSMTRYDEVKADLQANPKTWLITGVAGFIGSNLLETLLKLDQTVVGLDNFATGYQHNLDEVQTLVTEQQWARFRFIEGDIRNLDDCREAVKGTDYVLHQAALGSVPRSIEDPIATNQANVDGFLNILVASKNEEVSSFTYASSSSTYGDQTDLPKVEDKIGNPLSPYAVTKYVNELYASVFARTYGFKATGLRYFNVFGPRQDPHGAYAAVIPKWAASIIQGQVIHINGDGETSRDFCFINNAVQANLLAAIRNSGGEGQVYNVACNAKTSLTELFHLICNELARVGVNYKKQPVYVDFRPGDVRHSLADIQKAADQIGYSPDFDITEGLALSMPWYRNHLTNQQN